MRYVSWFFPRVLLARIPHRLILVAGALGLFSASANVAIAMVVEQALAHRLTRSEATLGLLAAAALLVLTGYASQALILRAAYRTVSALRLDLCTKVLALPLQRIELLGNSEILNVLVGDVQNLRATLLAAPGALVSLFTVIAGFAYLTWLSWTATALLVTVVAVSWTIAMRFQAHGQGPYDDSLQRQGTLFGLLSTAINGVKELKLNEAHAEQFMQKDVARTENEITDLQIRGHLSFVLQGLTAQLGFMVALAVVVVGPRWITGAPTQTAFVVTLLFVSGAIASLAGWFPEVAKSNLFFAKIEALGLGLDVEPQGRLVPSLPIAQQLQLLKVSYAYRADTELGERAFVLGPLDLTLRRGEILFVVGGNGSGKSTLAKLMSGLYWPEHGAIHVDGKRVEETEQRAYRASFSAVFADFQLFERLFDPNPALVERARAYLARLQISHRVRIEADRLVTSGLSQGQRKRLALVRAYLEDRSVYVFDEWAADQDPTWKDLFYRELLPELRNQGKAVVVISHDDRYFDVADRIIKLEEGQLVESGSRLDVPGRERA